MSQFIYINYFIKTPTLKIIKYDKQNTVIHKISISKYELVLSIVQKIYLCNSIGSTG